MSEIQLRILKHDLDVTNRHRAQAEARMNDIYAVHNGYSIDHEPLVDILGKDSILHYPIFGELVEKYMEVHDWEMRTRSSSGNGGNIHFIGTKKKESDPTHFYLPLRFELDEYLPIHEKIVQHLSDFEGRVVKSVMDSIFSPFVAAENAYDALDMSVPHSERDSVWRDTYDNFSYTNSFFVDNK